jgi:hypothetical protein
LKLDAEYLRQHYAELSDEALREIDRSELVEVARGWYDEEVARRRLAAAPAIAAEPPDSPDVEQDEGEVGPGDGSEPAWLKGAACVCSYVGGYAADDFAEARDALESAGVPCYVAKAKLPPENASPGRDYEYRVLVPGGRNLEALSVVDVRVFNPQIEADWKTHLQELTDSELYAISPKVICAGLLDRAERLKRAYEDEVARRSAGGL